MAYWIDNLGKATVFTVLIALLRCWQVPIKDENKNKNMFTSYLGNECYTPMQFVLRYTPATIQRALATILFKIRWRKRFDYIFNVFIVSNTRHQHFKDIDEVLTLLNKDALTLKLPRFNFRNKTLHILSMKSCLVDSPLFLEAWTQSRPLAFRHTAHKWDHFRGLEMCADGSKKIFLNSFRHVMTVCGRIKDLDWLYSTSKTWQAFIDEI